MTTLHWVPAQSATPRGVALVIHGLNVRPNAMQPLANCLAAAGVECLLLSLHGHGDNVAPPPGQSAATDSAARLESFRRVSYALWRDETAAAYAIAAHSRRLGAPLLLAGFSLETLMGCNLALTEPDVRFDRLILLAPALALRPHSRAATAGVLAPLRHPQPGPARLRANRGTPVAAYMALYAALARFGRGDLRRLDAPALVLIDPADELASYAGLARLCERLPRWTLCPVAKSAGAAHQVHHLVIDAPSVGQAAWTDMCVRITAFVQEPSSHADSRTRLPGKDEQKMRS